MTCLLLCDGESIFVISISCLCWLSALSLSALYFFFFFLMSGGSECVYYACLFVLLLLTRLSRLSLLFLLSLSSRLSFFPVCFYSLCTHTFVIVVPSRSGFCSVTSCRSLTHATEWPVHIHCCFTLLPCSFLPVFLSSPLPTCSALFLPCLGFSFSLSLSLSLLSRNLWWVSSSFPIVF